MRVHREALHLRTAGEFDVIDVTAEVEKAVLHSEVQEGYALVFSRHTTFAVLMNEKESGLLADTGRILCQLVPSSNNYLHDDFEVRTENMHPDEVRNGHAHLRQILAGRNSEYIPIAEGVLMLGEWQRIMLVEFDRPREREVLIQVCGVSRQIAELAVHSNGQGRRFAGINGSLNGEPETPDPAAPARSAIDASDQR